MASMGITIELTKAAKEFLADKGFDPAFGARPLRRSVQKYVEDPLAEEILKGNFASGSKVKVKFNKKAEELKFVDSTKDKGGDELKEHDEEVADLT
jgi:ATP-dependent Clp protease ATP-binding subunit ClpC